MRSSFILLFFLLISAGSSAVEYSKPPYLNAQDTKAFVQWKKQALKGKNAKSVGNKHYVNELIFSDSPYLKQHAFNPVNWKPWSEEVLNQSKQSNKLIFLSIGYSTCHWCHVMEKESFVDSEVAKLINKNFIAVKVDREELPHIDEYYAAALEQVKGSAGWPITVLINSQGLPVFIESYISKIKLKNLLARMSMLWQQSPDFLISSAKQIDQLLKQRYSLNADTDVPENFLETINTKLLAVSDKQLGGFSGDVKFPSESMLIYMLDQIQRRHSAAIEKQLKLNLDAMINGGLWDHVDGGFHRYSTDSQWLVPHYEKMLYNQAQLAIVYSRAYHFYREEKYLDVVRRTIDFSLNFMYEKKRGFWSAIDADFNGKEGDYYLWTAQELSGIKIDSVRTYRLPETDKLGILINNKNSLSEKEQEVVRILSQQRKARGVPHIDRKVLTSWNGLMLLALSEASSVLNDERYTEIAKQVADFLWEERFSQLSGRLMRLKNQQQEELFLEDYSFFSRGLIALYDKTGNERWLNRATSLMSHAQKLFIKDGKIISAYPVNASIAISKTQDSEVINAAAMFIRVLSLLDNRLGKNLLKSKHKELISIFKAKVTNEPLSHLFAARVLNSHLGNEVGSKRYFANRKGEIDITCEDYSSNRCQQLSINIKLAPGWHVNSHQPLQDYLIATKVSASSNIEVTYPTEKVVKLGFQKEPLSVFEGDFSIKLTKQADPASREYMQIPLQACSDNICLLPELHYLNF